MTTREQLTFLSAEPPVRRSASRGSARASLTLAATSALNLRNWLSALARGWSFGKTSPASSQAGKEAILPDSYRCSRDGKSPSPTEAGSARESSPTPPDATEWRGECLTLNIPEFPNFRGQSRSEGAVSSLSDILVRGNIPQRFYLTVKCAAGLLRRAAKRGKDLPRILKDALLALIRSECAQASPAAAREPSSPMS